MPLVTWDESTMGSGVRSVDLQHQCLIDMLNNFISSAADGMNPDELRDMFEFLGAYAMTHFSHEEQVMDTYQCPAALANKHAHARFLQDFAQVAARVEREGSSPAVVEEVENKLLSWLTSHICGCDVQLRKCIAGRAAHDPQALAG